MFKPYRICIFAGVDYATNVHLDSLHIAWMLQKEYPDGLEIDLLSTHGPNYDSQDNNLNFVHYNSIKSEEVPARIPTKAVLEQRCLNKYMEHNEPNIILQITHETRTGLMLSIATKRFDVPFIYRYSGDSFNAFSVAEGWRKFGYFGFHNIIGRLPLKFAARHIVFGPRGRRRLLNRGVPADNIAVLPPAIDITKFNTKQQPPNTDAEATFDEDRFSILFVGRPTRRKGFHFLLSHVSEITSIVGDVEFVFVGIDETDNPAILADEYANRTRFIGQVPPKHMPYYFQCADLLVQPSYLEGLPRIILEALASGTPVVAREVGEVGAVTDNTFTTTSEFLDLVRNYDDLTTDPVDDYDRRVLSPKYSAFFDRLCRAYSSG